MGDMCHILCTAKAGIESISCVRSHRLAGVHGSQSIFTAFIRAGGGTKVVFKSFNLDGPKDQIIFDWAIIEKQKNSVFIPYPIQTAISKDFRVNRSDTLFHDNSYLLTRFYADRDIFPRLVGTCGSFYVTEYINLAMDSNLIDDTSTLKSWANRVHLAVEMLQMVKVIDQENLLMCHVTPTKFGISDSGKIKIVDLDLILPKTMVDSLTSSGKRCNSHGDCSFHDCKSLCNLESGQCESPVINTNLQIICEKIFVGWSLPGRLLVPGLLMSIHTPMTLASLLRQCAHNLHSLDETAHVTARLSDTLTEIDITLEERRTFN